MAYGIGLIGNRPHQMGYGAILEARDDCDTIAAAEHNAEKAAPMAERFGVDCRDDYDAVLEDSRLDIVSICTPSGAHLEVGVDDREDVLHRRSSRKTIDDVLGEALTAIGRFPYLEIPCPRSVVRDVDGPRFLIHTEWIPC